MMEEEGNRWHSVDTLEATLESKHGGDDEDGPRPITSGTDLPPKPTMPMNPNNLGSERKLQFNGTNLSLPNSPALTPVHSPQLSPASKTSSTSSGEHASVWVSPDLSFRDILQGRRSDFFERRRSITAESILKSKKYPTAQDVSKVYNKHLLKQYHKTMRGYERLKAYNQKLAKGNERQYHYVDRLESTRETMETQLHEHRKSLTARLSLPQPPDINLEDLPEPDEFINDATASAEKAVELQRAAAAKAQEDYETMKAQVNRLQQRLAGLQRALKKESELRKKEKKDVSKRTEESQHLEMQVRRLNERLEIAMKNRDKEKRRAGVVKRQLEGMAEILAKEREKSIEIEAKKDKIELSSLELEKKIAEMEEKIAVELEEKKKYQAVAVERNDQAQKLRAQIAKIQSELAEQQYARARAESTADKLSSTFEEKFRKLQEQLKLEQDNKFRAEVESRKFQAMSNKLRIEIDLLEDQLKNSEAAAMVEVGMSRQERERVESEADAATALAAAVIAASQMREVEAEIKEQELLSEMEAKKAAVERQKKEQSEEMEKKKEELKKAAGEIKKMQQQIKDLEKKRQDDEKKRRALHNRVQDLLGHVRVYCRIRPLFEPHAAAMDVSNRIEDGVSVLEYIQHPQDLPGGSVMQKRKKRHMFTFDRVFDKAAPQKDLFDHIKPLITSSMDGHDVTLFAYGQTGSGKTYTMYGPSDCDLSKSPVRGIIPRSIDHMFATIEEAKERRWTYTLSASMMEIYNETIYDLLTGEGKGTNQVNNLSAPTKTKGGSRPTTPRGGHKSGKKAAKKEALEIRRKPDGRTEVVGLTIVPVGTAKVLHDLTATAAERATRASTAMNLRSSRSHTIFQLYIEGKYEGDKSSVHSMLTLVDLAGSERLSKTHADGARLEEAKKINQSLSVLGKTVRALAEKCKHIPFRDSKLTFLLRKALSGSGKTAVIVNITPAKTNSSESLQTLRFADKLKELTPKI